MTGLRSSRPTRPRRRGTAEVRIPGRAEATANSLIHREFRTGDGLRAVPSACSAAETSQDWRLKLEEGEQGAPSPVRSVTPDPQALRTPTGGGQWQGSTPTGERQGQGGQAFSGH